MNTIILAGRGMHESSQVSNELVLDSSDKNVAQARALIGSFYELELGSSSYCVAQELNSAVQRDNESSNSSAGSWNFHL